jgi:hypothetical protein
MSKTIMSQMSNGSRRKDRTSSWLVSRSCLCATRGPISSSSPLCHLRLARWSAHLGLSHIDTHYIASCKLRTSERTPCLLPKRQLSASSSRLSQRTTSVQERDPGHTATEEIKTGGRNREGCIEMHLYSEDWKIEASQHNSF